MKKMIWLGLMGLLIVGADGWAFAMMCGGGSDRHGSHHGATANMGNITCPVSGEKVGGMGQKAEYEYEYEGKVYNFCCLGCIDPFKRDPGAYIKKIGLCT